MSLYKQFSDTNWICQRQALITAAANARRRLTQRETNRSELMDDEMMSHRRHTIRRMKSLLAFQKSTRCVIITGTSNFQGQNLVNMRFIRTEISGPRHEIMLREVLSELLSAICTTFTV